MTKRGSDALRRRATQDAIRLKDGGVLEEGPAQVFSPVFRRRREKLPGQGWHPTLYRALRTAACLLLALLLSGCAVLAVSPAVWEAFSPWGAAPGSGSGAVKMAGSAETAPYAYRLGWVPEGYELFVSSPGVPARVVYLNRKGKWLALSIVDSAEAPKMELRGEGGAPYRQVWVLGSPAHLCWNGKGDRMTLVWTDAEQKLSFHLDGELTGEELIKIAEHVGREPVQPAEYRLMWVCDGGGPDAESWVTGPVPDEGSLQLTGSTGHFQ